MPPLLMMTVLIARGDQLARARDGAVVPVERAAAAANVMLPAPPSVAPYMVRVPETVDADAIVSDMVESVVNYPPIRACRSE